MSRTAFRIVRTLVDCSMILAAWLVAYSAFDKSLLAAAISAIVVGLYGLLSFADGLGSFNRGGENSAINELIDHCTTLRGERATLADWIAEALSVLTEVNEMSVGDAPLLVKRELIEQGNALVVAVRGGER